MCSHRLLADDVVRQMCGVRHFRVLAQWLEPVEKEPNVHLVILSNHMFDAEILHGPCYVKLVARSGQVDSHVSQEGQLGVRDWGESDCE